MSLFRCYTISFCLFCPIFSCRSSLLWGRGKGGGLLHVEMATDVRIAVGALSTEAARPPPPKKRNDRKKGQRVFFLVFLASFSFVAGTHPVRRALSQPCAPRLPGIARQPHARLDYSAGMSFFGGGRGLPLLFIPS